MAERLPMKKVKTPCCGEFYWVKGLVEEDGVLNELSQKNERSVTIRYHKDSEQCKALIAEIDGFWEEFKASKPKMKQKEPKSTVYKTVLDQDGEETDFVEFKFKTNPKFQDGKVNWVKIYNAKGQDVTGQFVDDQILIGNGSTGIVHGTLAIYEYAKQFGVTSYLKAIQIAKLVEYDDGIEPEDLTEELGEEAFEAADNNEAPLV